MYTRSESVTRSVQTAYPQTFSQTAYPQTFSQTAYPQTFSRPGTAAATRSTQPEIFTFERIPIARAAAVRSCAPLRAKKRCTRVMYPAKVRMHLPPVEKSAAKRWLLALCVVVLWQIYTEEPCAAEDGPVLQGLPLRSAEEQARRLTDADDFSSLRLPSCEKRSAPWFRVLSNTSGSGVETESARAYDQSARNGYMVALLVYHKLGSDK